ncbi:ATP-binding protein [Roseivirga sp. BDSF3-8]|uniref:ATP-binding protein n=1 Tax=Roseivirga sp. BDSF3-8 TaxID=3241598 RepID=UPI003531F457
MDKMVFLFLLISGMFCTPSLSQNHKKERDSLWFAMRRYDKIPEQGLDAVERYRAQAAPSGMPRVCYLGLLDANTRMFRYYANRKNRESIRLDDIGAYKQRCGARCRGYAAIAGARTSATEIKDSLYAALSREAVEAGDSSMASYVMALRGRQLTYLAKLYEADQVIDSSLMYLPDDGGYLASLCYSYQSILLEREGLNKEALHMANRALAIATHRQDTGRMIGILHGMGIHLGRMGNSDSSGHYFMEAIRLQETFIGEADPATLNNMANTFADIHDDSTARHYFFKSLRINRRRGEHRNLMYNFINLGVSYRKSARYDSALVYLDSCKHYASMIPDSIFMALVDFEKGKVYNRMGQHNKALGFTRAAYSQLKDRGAVHYLNRCRVLLARLYYEMENFAKALQMVAELNADDHEASDLADAYALAALKADIYEATSNHTSAVKHIRQAMELQDSLNRQIREEGILKLQAAFETKEKEAEIARLASESAEKERARRRLIFIIAIISLLTLALGWFMVNYYLAQRRLRAVGKVKDRILSLLAHDVRNPLQGLLGLIYLHKLKRMPANEQKEHLVDIEDKVKSLLKLTDGMLLWSKGQFEGSSLAPTKVRVADLMTEIKEEYDHELKERKLELRETLEVREVIADPDILRLVLRNLVGNAVRYTPTGGQIIISTASAGRGRVRISVQDNGAGLTDEQIDAVVRGKIQAPGEGAQGAKGKGMGLKLVQEFLALMGSRLHVKNNKEGGGSFSFYV